MCGIVGISMNRGEVSRRDIEAMNATIVHRGPDGAGVLVDGPTALAMRRLSIIDLDAGWQPIANETGDIHVIQNGEIYNYKELRQRLQQAGHRFRTNSDTETLVHAYEEWGADFPKKLRGMFAFAIWDSRKQLILLGRDRLGIKPLYYATNAIGLIFASELSAIVAFPQFTPVVDLHGVNQFLAFGCTGFEHSFLKGVRQLPPGCTAAFEQGELVETRYWTYGVHSTSATTLKRTRKQAVEELKVHLRDAVRSHLVSDVPVGAFLSGGIDSSGVVGLMAQELGSDFQVFSIGFDESQVNELEYAKRVARRWGLSHRFQIIRPKATEILDTLLDHFGEPIAESSAVPMWYLSRLAARHVKVVLTGDGGDEVFGGYRRYLRARRHRWLDLVPKSVRQFGRHIGERLPHWAPAKNFLQYVALDRRRRYATEMQLFPAFLRRSLVHSELQSDLLENSDSEDEFVERMCASPTKDPVSEFLYIDTLDYLPKRILTKVDRMTMAHGLESRPPLLDHRLVEFAATLPISQKITRLGSLKHIFKEALRPVVDEEILSRRKAGFKVPLDAWFAGPLSSRFQDLVLNNGHCLEYLAADVVQEIFAENHSGRRRHGERLWAILQFEAWLRRTFSRAHSHRPTTVQVDN